MTSGARAPAAREPRPGDAVVVNGREATFLYRRGSAAFVRYDGEADSRAVPFSKIRPRSA